MRRTGLLRIFVGYLVRPAEAVARAIDRLAAAHPREPIAWFRPDELAVPPGLYRDRCGHLWERTTHDWRMWLRSGATIDSVALWNWSHYSVCDHAPFVVLMRS
ncbi:hypothetical protein LTV02_20130 [Nocardia yamanashiensis]|uniref:hypothetical protein n=1 Tax=Nocardia yamanashiensis TaxID=209247 RepID=UPI001E55E6F0|nr:hypothetical protein [Nocardia yamanashiensis]UGT38471.1 hypothetical protein LTV02_20130 [Nocardia yamanashiensis]